MMVVVFTAVIGVTDALLPPRQIDPAARYLCFSDQPCTVAPYEWVPTAAGGSPRLTSRRVKILADHPILQAADVTVWHDASYRLRRDLRWAAAALRAADLAVMKHPRRMKLEDEALVIARYGYVTPDEGLSHVARYRAEGCATPWMSSAGLIARRGSERVDRFNAIWWEEVQRWNGRDQVSMDYSATVAGLQLRHLPGAVRENKFAAWREAVAA